MKSIIFLDDKVLAYSQCEPNNGDIIYVRDYTEFPHITKKLRVVRKQYSIDRNINPDNRDDTYYSTSLDVICEEVT